MPIMTLALTSDTLSAGQVYDAADTVLGQRLSQVEGVSQVQVNGAEKPAVRIQLDPVRLAATGLSGQDVMNAVRAANVTQPVGGFQTPSSAETIGINGQMSRAAEYAPLILKASNGAFVRISSVAHVIDSVANVRLAAWSGNQPAILLTITKEAGANVIDTVDRVREILPLLRSWIPPDIKMTVISDRTNTIRASVADVQYTLLITAALVLLVVFLFMRRLMPTVAAGVTVPLSIAGTLAGMWLLGYTLDNFSLMAITIGVGFVVDDAIVMIENIFRHMEHGETPLVAALNGARQIGFTVMSISLSLVAVFIPVIFMPGLLGRLFHEFAMTLTLAITISAVVSLTLTPMLCGRFMRREGRPPRGLWRRIDAAIERGLRATLAFYAETLGWALRHRRFMLLVTVGTVALTIGLYRLVPKGFLPLEDTGLIQGSTLASPDISFKAMSQRQRQVVDVLLKDPAVASVGSQVGVSSGFSSLNRGTLVISLKPLSQRGISSEQVIARLREPLSRIDGVQTFLYSAQDLRAGGRSGGSQYQFVLLDQDLTELRSWDQRLEEKLRTVAGIADVTSDQDRAGPQAEVMIDRVTAARLGVAVTDIDNALNNAFSQRQVSRIYTDRNQYNVVLEIDPRLQTDPSMLDHIYVGASAMAAKTPAGVAGAGTTGSTTATSSGTGNAASITSPAPTLSAASTSAAASSGSSTGTSIGTRGTNAAGALTAGTVLGGVQVPLSAVARIVRNTAPLAVRHQGQFPAATISFNVQPGMALGDATAAVENAARELRMPETVRYQFAGNARYLAQSLSAEPALIGAALLAIYIVLGVLYESLAQPLTIISTLPSAGIGALLALLLTGTELSVMSIIGIILLMGIVKKNAIMLIDFALEQERQHGRSPEAAIHAACLERFRPIIMTTLAALLGALPLACAFGTGAELRRPLGIAIVGGLIVSQMLTLYTTPVVYLALQRPARRRRLAPAHAD
ncbi:MAG: efflux RND transporter permease subunit [Acidisphaera sp.]|nr:efflux RND transporter permease subunit [Acidisphaera sp.]